MNGLEIVGWTLAVTGILVPLWFWYRKRLSHLADLLQIIVGALTVAGLVFVYGQMKENSRANKATTRGQLYEKESALALREADDPDQILLSVYAVVPPIYKGADYYRLLIAPLDASVRVANATSASELYQAISDIDNFKDTKSREQNRRARRLFIHVQEIFYHVHNAHDYKAEGILSADEWDTWKGLIREMGSHPMLLSAIWQGYQNRYFSSAFARFLQEAICPEIIPHDIVDKKIFERNRAFVAKFYPEMLQRNWPKSLPDY